MADINKTIKQLEADIDRARRTGEILVYVGRATARDCLELLKKQKGCMNCALFCNECPKDGEQDGKI